MRAVLVWPFSAGWSTVTWAHRCLWWIAFPPVGIWLTVRHSRRRHAGRCSCHARAYLVVGR